MRWSIPSAASAPWRHCVRLRIAVIKGRHPRCYFPTVTT